MLNLNHGAPSTRAPQPPVSPVSPPTTPHRALGRPIGGLAPCHLVVG